MTAEREQQIRHYIAGNADDIDRDLLALLDEARRERDLAIAHDRQPYPTAFAYEAVCVARDKHETRADEAEAALTALRAELEKLRVALRGFMDARRRCYAPSDAYDIPCECCKLTAFQSRAALSGAQPKGGA